MDEWIKKREVIRHYDQIAETYESQYAEEQTVKINAILPNVSLDERSFILDVGCGIGILLPFVARAQFVVGVDMSSKLLRKARQHTRKFSNTHIICGDSDFLPLQNNVFNIVFAITLLQNIPNPLATLEEIKRMCKRQALIAVTALRKEFSHENFTKLLTNAQLRILRMKTDEKLKDYVAICRRVS